jgi:hypothetical protein
MRRHPFEIYFIRHLMYKIELVMNDRSSEILSDHDQLTSNRVRYRFIRLDILREDRPTYVAFLREPSIHLCLSWKDSRIFCACHQARIAKQFYNHEIQSKKNQKFTHLFQMRAATKKTAATHCINSFIPCNDTNEETNQYW